MQSFIFEKEETFDEMATRMAKQFNAPYLKIENLPDNVLFIDTREENEFNVSHIKDAVHIGYKKVDLKKLIPYKNKTLIVYCSVGYRSGDITSRLRKKGFDAYNLYGGIFNWVNKEKALYKNKVQVNQIHGYNLEWGKWLKRGEVIYNGN